MRMYRRVRACGQCTKYSLTLARYFTVVIKPMTTAAVCLWRRQSLSTACLITSAKPVLSPVRAYDYIHYICSSYDYIHFICSSYDYIHFICSSSLAFPSLYLVVLRIIIIFCPWVVLLFVLEKMNYQLGVWKQCYLQIPAFLYWLIWWESVNPPLVCFQLCFIKHLYFFSLPFSFEQWSLRDGASLLPLWADFWKLV